MAVDFSSLHNHQEAGVLAAVRALAPRYPALRGRDDLLVDVACVALNRLTPRYIHHAVDYAFYRSESGLERQQQAVDEAVEFAFGFVQARWAMRARA
jgi:hypothetical protein